MTEIERKFLVTGDYKSLAHSSSRIRQGYICADGGRTVRVRLRDGVGTLTVKGPSSPDGVSRFEWETEVGHDDAVQMLGLCDGGFIDKTRYLVRCGAHTFEVDEFHGGNEGLVIAEVELQSVDEPFERPPFVGREVTGDRRYYNSSLMRHPYCTWDGE